MSAGQATAGRIPLLRQPLYRRFLAARTLSLFGDQVSTSAPDHPGRFWLQIVKLF